MNLLENQNFWTFIGMVATAIGGWFTHRWTFKGKQLEKTPDIQTSLNLMVKSMSEHYERLLALRDSDIKELRNENKEMRSKLDRLERHVDRIENALSAAGLDVPARPDA